MSSVRTVLDKRAWVPWETGGDCDGMGLIRDLCGVDGGGVGTNVGGGTILGGGSTLGGG